MSPAAKKQKLDNDEEKENICEEILDEIAASRLSCADNVAEYEGTGLEMGGGRVRHLAGEKGRKECGGVLYLMWRDKRVQDNWAMLYAQKVAMELKVPLHVAICIPKELEEMTIRHYTFLLEGLREVSKECKKLNISFHLFAGTPNGKITKKFLKELEVGLVVVDFSPLRYHVAWVDNLQELIDGSELSLHQVDGHNVVPVWVASDKQEYSARTIRPKITGKLDKFLKEFPPVVKHPFGKGEVLGDTFEEVYKSLSVDSEGWGVEPVSNMFKPGTEAGLVNLAQFVNSRLKIYSSSRNDPNKVALSNLSPWVNMGQISMQRAVLYVKRKGKSHSESVAGFVEEAVVRRELSENFCHYNKDGYDKVTGATDWAQKTLSDHKKDKREYIYTRKELEEARTHDDLWNAAQLQLVREGKMHGFLRMYWAKKVLEWTESPEKALKEALRLNDRYALDGNDPNGYVGVMWSICGIHDQGWGERNIFGKIRFMNYAGCKRKFDINKFIIKYGAKVFKK